MADTHLISHDTVYMPTAFSTKSTTYSLSKQAIIFWWLIIILEMILSIILSIVCFKFEHVWLGWLLPIAGLTAAACIREFILHERYFVNKYTNMIEHGRLCDSSTLWTCYNTEQLRNTTIFRLSGKYSMVLYQFHRDVIVGRGEYGSDDHLDQVAEAMRLLDKKNIRYMHLDAMSSVGQDPRFDIVKDINLSFTKDSNLKALLTHIYDYVKLTMDRAQTSYDYYAFFYDGDDEVFFADMREVFAAFSKANYNSYDSLGEIDIPSFMEYLAPLVDFSVILAKNKVCNQSLSNHIKILKTYDAEGNILTEYNTFENLEKQRLARQNTLKNKMKKS